MKTWSIAILGLAITLAGCQSTEPQATNSPQPEKPAPTSQPPQGETKLAGYKLGEATSIGNVSVIPLRLASNDTKPTQVGEYITFEQASKQGLVKITEMDDETVNKLKVTNKSTKPLLLVGGDICKGGNQDRIVAHDVVIPPGKTQVIDVFCVEQGRWEGPSKEFNSAISKAPYDLRGGGVVTSPDQGVVWEEAAKYNRERAVPESQGTSVMLGISGSVADAAKKGYDTEVRKALEGNDVVGVVLVRDGQLVSVEVFGNPALFASSRDTLINAIAAEVTSDTKYEVSGQSFAGVVDNMVNSDIRATGGWRPGPSRRSGEDFDASELHVASGKDKSPVRVHGLYVPKKKKE